MLANRKLSIPGFIVAVMLAVTVVVPFIQSRDFSPGVSSIGSKNPTFLNGVYKKKMANIKRYDQPREAWLFYTQKRVSGGTGVLPVEKYTSARTHMELMPQYNASNAAVLPSIAQLGRDRATLKGFQAWQQLGPGNIGGRTRTLVIHPANPNIMYIGGVSGGVWKSTNGGGKWVALDDLMANLAVTTLVMHPGKPWILYAGTGEGFFNIDAVRGNGIFMTTNGGMTWKQLASTANNRNFHYVNKIVVSPNNPQRLYAATRTGIWRSSNGGMSWRSKYASAEVGGCLDIVVRADTPVDHLLVSCGNFGRATIYRSTNNGETFTGVLSEPNMGRTSLANSPSNPGIAYALAASIDPDFANGLHAVFRSINGGKTWLKQVGNNSPRKLNTLLLSNPVFASLVECGFAGPNQFLNQGWYDNVIAVDPKNPRIVWVGGIDLFRSDDAGKNWGLASYWWPDTTTPSYAHSDQHAIVFHPKYNGTSNRQIFVTNDGGIFKTFNSQAATARGPLAPCGPRRTKFVWRSLNNSYAVTQFYHGVPYPSGKRYFGGTQDNGTVRGGDAAGPNKWLEIDGGDGGYVAVNPNRPLMIFAENTGLSINKSTDGGVTGGPAIDGISESPDNFLFINPFLMDQNNSKNMWTGGKTAWRSSDHADNWVQASVTNMAGNGKFSAWAVARGDSNSVAAGTSAGIIATTKEGQTAGDGTIWRKRKPASGFVSSLAYHPDRPNVLYATFSTFGVNHVWKSIDDGRSWIAIDKRGQANGIPDLPVHSIVVHPDFPSRLFVGTDLGIFVTTNGGNSWVVDNTGFTNTVVEHLEILTVAGDNYLYAFTHGRGTWRTLLSP